MILYNKKDCCHHIAGIVFVPGINEIDDASFNKLKEHTVFESLLNSGVFKVIKEKEEEKIKDEIVHEINPTATPSKKEEMKKELKTNKVKGSINVTTIGNKKEAK